MKKIILLLTLLISLNSYSCRFTVREIGFSDISRTQYMLYIIYNSDYTSKPINLINKTKELTKDSNISLRVVNLKEKNVFPTNLNYKNSSVSVNFCSPKGDILNIPFAEAEFFLNNNLFFSLGESQINSFATVLFFEGKDIKSNRLLENKIKLDIDEIRKTQPRMPKVVKESPKLIKIAYNDREKNKLLTWSLNIVDKNAYAAVIYGKSKLMGKPLNFEDINSRKVHKMLSLVGVDCECGFDKTFFSSATQLPIHWSSSMQSTITNKLGFDTNNPMILAEMSQIISKQGSSTVTSENASHFEPTELDLDNLNIVKYEEKEPEDVVTKEPSKSNILYIVIAVMIVGIALSWVVMRIFFR